MPTTPASRAASRAPLARSPLTRSPLGRSPLARSPLGRAVLARTAPTRARHAPTLDRLLVVTAWAETVTLVVLLVNVVTVHAELVTGTVGPLHGGLYLLCSAAVVGMRWVRGWSWLVVALGLLPAVGALVALEALRRDRRAEAGTTPTAHPAGSAP